MDKIDTLLQMTRDGVPWALARFNDGEMSAIVKRTGTISRGAQEVTEGLADALEAALKYRADNYWLGLPCRTCWPKHRQMAETYIDGFYPFRTSAVVLTNRNHQRWQEEFPKALGSRRVVWVGGAEQANFPFPLEEFIAIPARNAFTPWDDNWRKIAMSLDEGAMVLCSCGPLGRMIAHRWFELRPDLTVIDVGSIYDPITLDRKTARLHQGKLPPCKECH